MKVLETYQKEMYEQLHRYIREIPKRNIITIEGLTSKMEYMRRLEFPKTRSEFWEVVYGFVKREFCRLFVLVGSHRLEKSNTFQHMFFLQLFQVRVINPFWSHSEWHKLLSVNAVERVLYVWKMIYLILKIWENYLCSILFFHFFSSFAGHLISFFVHSSWFRLKNTDISRIILTRSRSYYFSINFTVSCIFAFFMLTVNLLNVVSCHWLLLERCG